MAEHAHREGRGRVDVEGGHAKLLHLHRRKVVLAHPGAAPRTPHERAGPAEDEHSDKLFKQAIDDASCGRMEYPVQLHDDDTFLASVRIARRFSVEQGVKPDGSLKVRAVDDESRNGVNGVTDAMVGEPALFFDG